MRRISLMPARDAVQKRSYEFFVSEFFVSVVLFSCLALRSDAPAARHSPMDNVHIEVNLYSGRENPGWDLGPADASEFRTRLAALPQLAEPGASVPDQLGYRGLHIVQVTGGTKLQFDVASGMVIVGAADPSNRRILRDPDRSLERWLLLTGKQHLDADLLRYLLGLIS